MELISSKHQIDFIGNGKWAIMLSLLAIAASVYIWIAKGEAKYGTDYQGGFSIILQFEGNANAETIAQALSKGGVKDAVAQSFEASSGQFVVKVGAAAGTEAAVIEAQVVKALTEAFGKAPTVLQTDFVGPTIGKELREKAVIAILLCLIGILAYVAFRFEMSFAVGGVLALFHDVIIGLGVYLYCGLTLSAATLAAALTIVGYSINDTIIVFDRVREDRAKMPHATLSEVMNKAINSTLSRTVITSMLTLFSATALLIYGGGAIEELALFLVTGIIVGTYSSIFVAAPIAVAWERMRNREAAAPVARKRAA